MDGSMGIEDGWIGRWMERKDGWIDGGMGIANRGWMGRWMDGTTGWMGE
jgi:hypothetical protein